MKFEDAEISDNKSYKKGVQEVYFWLIFMWFFLDRLEVARSIYEYNWQTARVAE